jgi:hypothetical protein
VALLTDAAALTLKLSRQRSSRLLVATGDGSFKQPVAVIQNAATGSYGSRPRTGPTPALGALWEFGFIRG